MIADITRGTKEEFTHIASLKQILIVDIKILIEDAVYDRLKGILP